MATASTGASALVSAAVVPPPSGATAGVVPAPATPVKTMQQLLNEIEKAKGDVETNAKRLEKIDTGRKKAAANRESSVEGRTQIKDLTEHINNLQKQMEAMTKESDPTWSVKKFDKTKRDALKTLTSLSGKLTHADKHLEKATGTLTATATPTPAQPVATSATPAVDAQPVIAPATAATTDGAHAKGLGALIGKLPFGGRRKRERSPQVPVTTAPATTAQATPPPAPAVAVKSDAKKEVAVDEVSSDLEEGRLSCSHMTMCEYINRIVSDPTIDSRTEHERMKCEWFESDDDAELSDDDDVVTDKKQEIRKSPRPVIKASPIVAERKPSKKISSEEDSEDDSDYDDDDDVADSRQLVSVLQKKTSLNDDPKDLGSTGRRSRTPTTPRDSKKTSAIKTETPTTESTKPSSHVRKKTTTPSPPPPSVVRKKPPSPRRRTEVPAAGSENESDEGTYFEEEEEDDEDREEDELRRLHDSGEHEEGESDHDFDEQEEDEGTTVNAYVQELRASKYAPGTQFRVTHNLAAAQPDDLTLHKNDILTLVEQRPDDWWLMRNNQTQQQGMAPINHIKLLSEPHEQQRRRRTLKTPASTTTLVDVFKANNNIPAGFIPSDLAPLTQLDEYQLWRILVPIMTESNLGYADLHWRVDEDRIHVQHVTHQKILILKECIKVPRIKGEQVRVLDRCVRVCLYDGFEIISNVHTIRARIPKKLDEQDRTEDWTFKTNNLNTFLVEQSHLLIRSRKLDRSRHLHLLIELAQWCQSSVTQEKCEIGCGWTMIQLDEQELPLITDTKNYTELLHGGHTDESNVLLHPDYKVLRSTGLSGKIDRLKRARIKFSIESRDDDLDRLFDNLPTQPLIVPMNLTRVLGFYRHELAYQLHQRHHPTGLSTTPIDSIFLSTFFQTLTQPDLIDILNRIYRLRKRKYLSSSATYPQQRREFIETYELYIYPLLNYRQLPPYDFHDLVALAERRKLIDDLVKRHPPTDKTHQDILTILLDKDLTDKWTPFTTSETCFSLQNYVHELTREIAT